MSEKVTGYVLVGVGILVMIISLIQIVSVMSGGSIPLHIFKYSETANSDGSSGVFDPLNPTSLLDSLNSGDLSSINLIDPRVITDLLNIIVYYLILQFVMGFGYKIASLGVQLLRPIHVDMKHRDLKTDQEDTPPPLTPDDSFN